MEQGLADKETEAAMLSSGSEAGAPAAFAYMIQRLLNFNRGYGWDAQRLGGSFHTEFVDYATVLIGLYAAASGIPRQMILSIENLRARTSYYSSDKKMDKAYTFLPEDNVRNTDLGYQLYQESRIVVTQKP